MFGGGQVPSDQWSWILGFDFGIVDLNGVAVLGWRDHDPCVYVVEGYRLKAGVTEMAEEAQRLIAKYKPDRIVGDLGGMGKAFGDEMRRRYAIPIEPADKHAKVATIGLVNDAFRQGRIKILDTCKDLIDELLTLPWADSLEDRRENRQREADGFSNHAVDAMLYSWRAAYAFVNTPKPVRPQPGTPEYAKQLDEETERQQQEQWEREQRESEYGF